MKFWRFTLHEPGTHDLSTMSSGTRDIEGKSSLSYASHNNECAESRLLDLR